MYTGSRWSSSITYIFAYAVLDSMVSGQCIISQYWRNIKIVQCILPIYTTLQRLPEVTDQFYLSLFNHISIATAIITIIIITIINKQNHYLARTNAYHHNSECIKLAIAMTYILLYFCFIRS